MACLVQLDPKVEVVNDDQGRVVLLPHDSRSPIRLSQSDETLLRFLQSGTCDMDGRGDNVCLTEHQRKRFNTIAVALDRAGLLAGRRVAPEYRMVHSPALAKRFDALADVLTRPLIGVLSVRSRGRILKLFTATIVIGLIALWWSAQGRMFAAAISPYWLLSSTIFVLIFPIAHEFSHALTGRLFGFEVTAVGAQHRGGMNWSPFVETRRATLSSDATARIWIPLVGVVCNLFLALLAGLWLVFAPSGSLASGVAGMLTVLLHIRVLIDGGFGIKTDASQALRISGELLKPADHVRLIWLVRGGYILFLVSCMCMLALSFKNYGSHG